MKPDWTSKCGTIQLYNADCRDVLPTLDAGSVDLVLTDPPYSEETHAGARTSIDEVLVDFDSITSDELHTIIAACSRILNRWFVAFMDWRHILPLERQPPDGMRFVRFGIWHKPNGAPQFTGDRPATGWEAIGIMHKTEMKMVWNGGGHHAVWRHNKENGPHRTMKPLGLVIELQSLFSNAGDCILDPFMGSGTTGVAAARFGRKFIGIELDPKHFATAVSRITAELSRAPLFTPPTPNQTTMFEDVQT